LPADTSAIMLARPDQRKTIHRYLSPPAPRADLRQAGTTGRVQEKGHDRLDLTVQLEDERDEPGA